MSNPLKITPVILGNGRAGHAIAESLAILNVLRPEFGLTSPRWLKRGQSLAEGKAGIETPLLVIANPHGLHAAAILEADRAGYGAILCEKPACVNLSEVAALRAVRTPTAIFHVYRQMWGMQTLRRMLTDGELGELITIEGRYWQSSAAERALDPEPAKPGWKDEVRLSGESDTYFDVGCHWIDAASFLAGRKPSRIAGWRSYQNAPSSHRDSHVQVAIDFMPGRAFGSISKTVHGAPNHFEVNVIGTKKSATWKFLEPDEILVGEGRDRRVVTRRSSDLGSQHPPHHGTGWLEGYIEIASSLLASVYGGEAREYPTLAANLDLLEAMLKTEWSGEARG